MTPEQLTWNDKQWAEYLGCSATDVPKFKNWLAENYCLGIYQDDKSGKKFIELKKVRATPSGWGRLVSVVSSTPCNASLDDMVRDANTKFIPSLTLTEVNAQIYGVPTKVLQMLHIENKKGR